MLSSIIKGCAFTTDILKLEYSWTTAPLNHPFHWKSEAIWTAEEWPDKYFMNTTGTNLNLLSKTQSTMINPEGSYNYPYNYPQGLIGDSTIGSYPYTDWRYSTYLLYRTNDLRTFTQINSKFYRGLPHLYWDNQNYIFTAFEATNSSSSNYKILTSKDLVTISEISIYTVNSSLSNGYYLSYVNGKYILTINNIDGTSIIKVFDTFETFSTNTTTQILQLPNGSVNEKYYSQQIYYYGNRYITLNSGKLYTSLDILSGWSEFIIPDLDPVYTWLPTKYQIWDNYIFYTLKRTKLGISENITFVLDSNFTIRNFTNILIENQLPPYSTFCYINKMYQYVTSGYRWINSKPLNLDLYFL